MSDSESPGLAQGYEHESKDHDVVIERWDIDRSVWEARITR
jgi:hypothetical protein